MSESLGRSVIREGWFVQAGSASDARLTRSYTIDLAHPLVGAKEKQSLLANRPTDSNPKLVLLQVWSPLAGLVQKEIVCVENIVTRKFEERCMVLSAAGLCDYADVGA